MCSVSDSILIMNCEKISLTDNPSIENNEISECPSSSVSLDIAIDHYYAGSKANVKHIKVKKHGSQLASLKSRIKKKNNLKNLNKNTQLHKTCPHPDCLETFSRCDEFQAYKFT